MKAKRFRFVVLLAAAVLAGFGCAGCTSAQLTRVKPWERGQLAEYSMNPSRDPLAVAAAEHMYFSREAASGGRAVGGSGCGCN